MAELSVTDLTLTVGQTALVDQANFRLAPGEFIALLGSNGAGKTSLIRTALGIQKPTAGSSLLGGADVARLSAVERARQIAYLPQTRPLAWPSRVRDVVALGRFSHGTPMARLKGDDLRAVNQAIADCDLINLADRNADTLSGGEQARMHCARAFAAEAPLLVADEPTAALDPFHQFQVLDLISGFVEKGGGALVVMHDVQLAARYATRLIWMKRGRIIADGAPSQTLTPDRVHEIYGVRAEINGMRITLERS